MGKLKEEICKIRDSQLISSASCCNCHNVLTDLNSYVRYFKKNYCLKQSCQRVRQTDEREHIYLMNWFADCDFKIPQAVISEIFEEPLERKSLQVNSKASSLIELAKLAEIPKKVHKNSPKNLKPKNQIGTSKVRQDNSMARRKRPRGETDPKPITRDRCSVYTCHICKRKIRTLQVMPCRSCKAVFCSYCIPRDFYEKCIVCRGECVCNDCVKETFMVDFAQISNKHQKTQVS